MDTTAKNSISDAKTSTVNNYTTRTEIMQNTAPSYSDTASNTEYDMFYLQNGVTREEYEEMKRASFKSAWRCLDCKFGGKRLTIDRVIDKLNEPDKYGKMPHEANTYFFIVERLYACADRHVKEGKMNDTEFQEFQNAILSKSGRYFAWWTKRFNDRKPNKNNPNEMKMFDLLSQMGKLKQSTQKCSTTA